MERHFHFDVSGAKLLGVLHTPGDSAARKPVALVLLHGWAGYRVGAHQMFVKLAREACNRGFVCMRFDFRGRGDSEGDMMSTTLTTMIRDAIAAARIVMGEDGVERVVYVGDCSGSEVAIGAGVLTEGCSSLVLWSAPIVGGSREEADKAKQRHILRQYWDKLFRRETWAKLLGGKLQLGMIRRAIAARGKGAGEEGAESDKDIDWIGRFTKFPGDALFIYGGQDPTTEAALAHFEKLTADAGRRWHSHIVDGANHAFYSTAWEKQVVEETLDWIEQREPE